MVPDRWALTSDSIFMDSITRTVSPSLTASPSLHFMEKMDPGRGAIKGEPLPALGAGATDGAGAEVGAGAGDVPIAPPVETSTVKSLPLTRTLYTAEPPGAVLTAGAGAEVPDGAGAVATGFGCGLPRVSKNFRATFGKRA